MVGTGFGVGSLIRGEEKSVSGSAMTLGINAAIIQWSLIFAGALIFILLIGVVLGELGIDLPSI